MVIIIIKKKQNIEAFKWYNLSAKHGNSEGQFNLARSYEYGYGILMNDNLAFDYYIMSGKNRYPEA